MTLEAQPTDRADSGWDALCPAADLRPGQGFAAVVHGHRVVVFRTCDGELFALTDRDPLADPGRAVGALSRGRLCSRRDRPAVEAAGTHRVFDLATGRCVTGGPAVDVHAVRTRDAVVEVAFDAGATRYPAAVARAG